VPFDPKATVKFDKLWRTYSNTHNKALFELLQRVERQDEDLVNPLIGGAVEKALVNWQKAVVDGPGMAPFREEARNFFILDPRPVVGIVRLFESGINFYDEVENRYLRPDEVHEYDQSNLVDAQGELRRYVTGNAAEKPRIRIMPTTRFLEEDIFYDPINKIPLNLIRYVVYCWKDLTDAERQRSIEVLSGWVKTRTNARYLPRQKNYSLAEELQSGVAITLRDFHPPDIITLDVTSRIDAARQRAVLSVSSVPRIQLWCKKLAKSTTQWIVNAYRQHGPDVNLEHIDLADTSGTFDDVEEFHSLEEARVQIKETFPQLTEREQQVCSLRSTGMTYKEIADALAIGAETVKELLARARKRAKNEMAPCRAYQQAHKSPRSKKKSF